MRDTSMWFYVEAKTQEDMNDMGKIILTHKVDWDVVNDVELIVYPFAGHEDSFRLCEMDMQMNTHQKQGNVCPRCADQDNRFCGHLTFTRRINPAF